MTKITIFSIKYLDWTPRKEKTIKQCILDLTDNDFLGDQDKKNFLISVSPDGRYEECVVVNGVPGEEGIESESIIIKFITKKHSDLSMAWDDNFVLVHDGNIKDYFENKNKITISGKDNFHVFSGKSDNEEGEKFLNFCTLINAITTDGREAEHFKETLDTLLGKKVPPDKALISMKLLFLPAYWAAKDNVGQEEIDKEPFDKIIVSINEESQKNWKDLRRFFDSEGELISGKAKEMCEEYEKLCEYPQS